MNKIDTKLTQENSLQEYQFQSQLQQLITNLQPKTSKSKQPILILVIKNILEIINQIKAQLQSSNVINDSNVNPFETNWNKAKILLETNIINYFELLVLIMQKNLDIKNKVKTPNDLILIYNKNLLNKKINLFLKTKETKLKASITNLIKYENNESKINQFNETLIKIKELKAKNLKEKRYLDSQLNDHILQIEGFEKDLDLKNNEIKVIEEQENIIDKTINNINYQIGQYLINKENRESEKKEYQKIISLRENEIKEYHEKRTEAHNIARTNVTKGNSIQEQTLHLTDKTETIRRAENKIKHLKKLIKASEEEKISFKSKIESLNEQIETIIANIKSLKNKREQLKKEKTEKTKEKKEKIFQKEKLTKEKIKKLAQKEKFFQEESKKDNFSSEFRQLTAIINPIIAEYQNNKTNNDDILKEIITSEAEINEILKRYYQIFANKRANNQTVFNEISNFISYLDDQIIVDNKFLIPKITNEQFDNENLNLKKINEIVTTHLENQLKRLFNNDFVLKNNVDELIFEKNNLKWQLEILLDFITDHYQNNQTMPNQNNYNNNNYFHLNPTKKSIIKVNTNNQKYFKNSVTYSYLLCIKSFKNKMLIIPMFLKTEFFFTDQEKEIFEKLTNPKSKKNKRWKKYQPKSENIEFKFIKSNEYDQYCLLLAKKKINNEKTTKKQEYWEAKFLLNLSTAKIMPKEFISLTSTYEIDQESNISLKQFNKFKNFFNKFKKKNAFNPNTVTEYKESNNKLLLEKNYHLVLQLNCALKSIKEQCLVEIESLKNIITILKDKYQAVLADEITNLAEQENSITNFAVSENKKLTKTVTMALVS